MLSLPSNATWCVQACFSEPSCVVQKPTPNELPALVAPIAEHMQAATALIEGRRNAVFNHQKAVAESLHALSWMVYTGPNCGTIVPHNCVYQHVFKR